MYARLSAMAEAQQEVRVLVDHPDDAEMLGVACARLAAVDRRSIVRARGIEAVVGVMRTHLHDVQMQQRACVVLAKVACTAEIVHRQAVLNAPGNAVEAVVQAMRSHSGNLGLQHVGCMVLESLVREVDVASEDEEGEEDQREGESEGVGAGGDADATVPSTRPRARSPAQSARGHRCGKRVMVDVGGIEAVVCAMQSFPGSLNIQMFGCGVLGKVGYRDDGIKALVGKAGGPATVLQSMRNFLDSPKLQELGCETLSMLMVEEEQCKKSAVEHGAQDVVMVAMRSYLEDAGVQRHGFNVLAHIWETDADLLPEGFLDHLDFEAVNLVVDGMRAHKENAQLQHAGCRALMSMAYAGKASQLYIVKARGIEVILAAMEAHAKSAQLLESACGALQNITDDAEENRSLPGMDHLVKAVVKAMLAHPESPTLQQLGCGFLANVAGPANNKALVFKEAMAAIRAAELTCSKAISGGGDGADSSWLDTKRRVEWIFGLLAADPRLFAQLSVADRLCGVRAFVQVLDSDPKHEVDVYFCLDGLASLAADSACRSAILREAGETAVVSAMRANPASVKVQIEGARALWNIAQGDEQALRSVAAAAAASSTNASTTSTASAEVVAPGLDGSQVVPSVADASGSNTEHTDTGITSGSFSVEKHQPAAEISVLITAREFLASEKCGLDAKTRVRAAEMVGQLQAMLAKAPRLV